MADDLTKLRQQIVLQQYEKHFKRDFEFADVKLELTGTVLTHHESNSILELDSLEKQTEKLFFILSYRLEILIDFINAIEEKYDWLSHKMRSALDDHYDDNEVLEKISHNIQVLRAEMPRLADFNVPRMEYLFKIQQYLKILKPMQYVVIKGNLVFGKQWLAIDACSNYTIMDCMDYNIFLLNLSKCDTNEKILENLMILYNMLGTTQRKFEMVHDENISNKIIVLRQILIEELKRTEYAKCLLILADVQSDKTVDAFKLQCKIMITTRNKKILDKLPLLSTKQIDVNTGFNVEESLLLFGKVLGVEQSQLPDEAQEIHDLCSGNPFLISIIASNIRDYTSERWKKWVEILSNYTPTDDEQFLHVIEKSLGDLDDDIKKLFESFAIFSDDIKIPFSLLQLYWNGKTEMEVETIVSKLDKQYLLETIKNGKMFCLLQYHYSAYLASIVSKDKKQQMHRKLVESYKIEEAIKNRTEPNIILFPNDKYFYFYIAYHLKEADMTEIFPKLFLDFGFLEQKLRATGLPNTIGDLTTYRQEIIGDCKMRRKLLDDLLEFLPNVEEMLRRSPDTCLLQYAITTDCLLQKEALKQASQFEYRLFFNDSDHIYKHRQMVQLAKVPICLRFLDANTAIIACEDNTILLTDLSKYYSIESTLFEGHTHSIIDIQLHSINFFLSLDLMGNCNLYTLKDTAIQRRLSSYSSSLTDLTGNRRSGGHQVRQDRAESFNKRNIKRRQYVQSVTATSSQDQFNCMYLMKHNNKLHSVYFGTRKGDVTVFTWDETKSMLVDRVDMPSGTVDIISMIGITSQYLMLLNGRACVYMYELKTASIVKRYLTEQLKYLHPIQLFSLSKLGENKAHRVAVVCTHKVVETMVDLTTNKQFVYKEIYDACEAKNRIICGTLTDDMQYLILGTRQGISVYDLKRDLEMLRGSVSDTITCIDVYSLNSDMYKYGLICGTKAGREMIHLYGLESDSNGYLMQWASDRMGSPINDDSLLGKDRLNTWLVGGDLFEVSSIDEKGNFSVLAIDSKSIGHLYSSEDNFKYPKKLQLGNERGNKIMTMSTLQESVMIGCENGEVFIDEDLVMECKSEVTFTQMFSTELRVAGTSTEYTIRFRQNEVSIPSCQIARIFLIDDEYLSIVKVNSSFEVFNLKNGQIIHTEVMKVAILGGCDLVDDCFIIASANSVNVWAIGNSSADAFSLIQVGRHGELTFGPDYQITCIKLSAQKEYCAIGFTNGAIHLYTLKDYHLLSTLKSHCSRVNAMHFSPWTSASTTPVILVSISVDLCFWNITLAINNQTFNINGNGRRSHRFGDRRRVDAINGNDTTTNTNGIGTSDNAHSNISNGISGSNSDYEIINGNLMKETNPYVGKTGVSAKPELLSCIKFVGNAAKRIFFNTEFTQFLTIDDEGDIYFLRTLNVGDRLRQLERDANDINSHR